MVMMLIKLIITVCDEDRDVDGVCDYSARWLSPDTAEAWWASINGLGWNRTLLLQWIKNCICNQRPLW